MVGNTLVRIHEHVEALAVDDGDGWRVTFAFARNADPAGLVSVPIEPAA